MSTTSHSGIVGIGARVARPSVPIFSARPGLGTHVDAGEPIRQCSVHLESLPDPRQCRLWSAARVPESAGGRIRPRTGQCKRRDWRGWTRRQTAVRPPSAPGFVVTGVRDMVSFSAVVDGLSASAQPPAEPQQADDRAGDDADCSVTILSAAGRPFTRGWVAPPAPSRVATAEVGH